MCMTVMSTLQSLNPSKSPGPDGIPSRLLKELAPQISHSITSIFNKSLNDGRTVLLHLFLKLIKKTLSPTTVVLPYYLYYLEFLRDKSSQDYIIMSLSFFIFINMDLDNNLHVLHSFFNLCTLSQNPLMMAYRQMLFTSIWQTNLIKFLIKKCFINWK